MSRSYRAAKFAMAASGLASATSDERRLASAASLSVLLTTPPRLLSSSDLHSCLALLDDTTSACRAELQRRPSHCRAPPPKKAAAAAAAERALLELPTELLAFALSFLRAPSLAACDRVSRSFHEPQGLVERALRLRALGSGHAPAALPSGPGCKQRLLLRDWSGEQLPQVACGVYHSLFISADGALLAAGGGDYFEVPAALGLGADVEVAAVPTRLACPRRYSSVAAGISHSLATTSDGQVFSWGEGSVAGHAEDVAVPTLLPALSQIYVCCVSACTHHSLAVTDEGAVFSWGRGPFGMLGHGNEEAYREPKRVEALRDQRMCMVAAGEYHSLAVSCTGGLYSWGLGVLGRLGHGNTNDQPLPKRVEAEGLQEGVRSVAAGDYFSLAITDSGALYTWGDNSCGVLGHGDVESRIQPERVAALQQERVRCVAAGETHTLAVTDSGELYSWGYGQLGRAPDEPADPEEEEGTEDLVPTLVQGLDPICAVAAGAGNSIVVTRDGRAFGFGYGKDACLGLSLTEHQFTPLEYSELRFGVPTA